MQVLPAKKAKRKLHTGRYSKGLKNQNRENFVNLFESNSFRTRGN